MAEIKVSKVRGTDYYEVSIGGDTKKITLEEAGELLDKLDSCIHDRHVHNTTFQIYSGPGAHTQQIPQSGLHSPGAHDQQIPKPASEYRCSALTRSIAEMHKINEFFEDMSRVLGDEDGQIIAKEILDLIDMATKR